MIYIIGAIALVFLLPLFIVIVATIKDLIVEYHEIFVFCFFAFVFYIIWKVFKFIFL